MILSVLKRILRLIAALYIGALIVGWVVDPEPILPHPFFEKQGTAPLAIAHRGGPELGPESTLHTYRRVSKLGIDVLEIDVHATADGHLIVAHDRRVDRVTDGSGPIAEMNFDSLRSLDAGHNWTLDGVSFPLRDRGIQMPTVDEMFEEFNDWRFVIELKGRTPEVARNLCESVRRHGMGDRVAVASFSGDALVAFRAACPGVLTSGSFGENLLFWTLHVLRLDDLYTPTPFSCFMVPIKLGLLTIVDERFIETAHRRNLAVQVWTVDEKQEMEWLIDLGVDGIMTDHPTRLISLLHGAATQ
ncbi:MAG: glycerophosphodiester phosphodiesterase [Gemmatimonadetes bacterium]|jgi:glycerophosphoryl diester phosphodiesterase|nr:glycerophosphodiester phosphodiesterase [Gemmatimonadota bacterium]MBT6145272.1 glycerophosphodiester phosphodiesterase [Gemmatimonadota bacterium]MBT7858774.1 glycerophosphodiester phosphodiesterase [Gemmatimonadota bacterium]